eukprot:gene7641-11963_t
MGLHLTKTLVENFVENGKIDEKNIEKIFENHSKEKKILKEEHPNLIKDFTHDFIIIIEEELKKKDTVISKLTFEQQKKIWKSPHFAQEKSEEMEDEEMDSNSFKEWFTDFFTENLTALFVKRAKVDIHFNTIYGLNNHDKAFLKSLLQVHGGHDKITFLKQLENPLELKDETNKIDQKMTFEIELSKNPQTNEYEPYFLMIALDPNAKKALIKKGSAKSAHIDISKYLKEEKKVESDNYDEKLTGAQKQTNLGITFNFTLEFENLQSIKLSIQKEKKDRRKSMNPLSKMLSQNHIKPDFGGSPRKTDNEELNKLKDQLNNLEDEKSILQQKVTESQLKFDIQLHDLNSTITKLQQAQESLRLENETLNNTLKEKEEKIHEIEQTKEEFESFLKEKEEKIKDFEEMKNDSKNQDAMNELLSKILNLEIEKKNLDELVSNLKKEKENVMNDYESQLNASEKQLESEKEKIDSLIKEIELSKSKIEEKQEEINKMNIELKEVQEKHVNEITKMKEIFGRIKENLTQKIEEKEKLLEEKDTSSNNELDISVIKQELEEKIVKLTSEKDEIEINLKNVQQEEENSKHLKEELNEKYLKLKDNLSNSEMNFQKVQEENEKLKQTNDEIIKNLRETTSELTLKKMEENENLKNITILNQEVERYSRDYSQLEESLKEEHEKSIIAERDFQKKMNEIETENSEKISKMHQSVEEMQNENIKFQKLQKEFDEKQLELTKEIESLKKSANEKDALLEDQNDSNSQLIELMNEKSELQSEFEHFKASSKIEIENLSSNLQNQQIEKQKTEEELSLIMKDCNDLRIEKDDFKLKFEASEKEIEILKEKKQKLQLNLNQISLTTSESENKINEELSNQIHEKEQEIENVQKLLQNEQNINQNLNQQIVQIEEKLKEVTIKFEESAKQSMITPLLNEEEKVEINEEEIISRIQKGNIKIMTFNIKIKKIDEQTDNEKVEKILKLCKESSCDLIFLQDTNEDFEKIFRVELKHHYPFQYYQQSGEWEDGGMGTLSKIKVETITIKIGSKASPFTAQLTFIDKFQFLNVHLSQLKDYKKIDESSFEKVIQNIKSIQKKGYNQHSEEIEFLIQNCEDEENVIILGDFNDQEIVNWMKKRKFKDCLEVSKEKSTFYLDLFLGLSLVQSYDHIFHSLNFECKNCEVLNEFKNISKHVPLMATLNKLK